MTQISDAKKGILTEEMKHVAKIENVSDTGNVRRILVDDSEDVVEGEDAETLAEIAGSSIEAWQVNFRGLSAHSSLSLMVKRAIETCYELDENGN
jgi:thiamine biosynthesis protein ThiC